MAARKRTASFDRERGLIFLDKADIALADDRLANLRHESDAELGIDESLLRQAASAFGIPANARIVRAGTQGTFHRLFEVRDGPPRPSLLRVAALAGPASCDLMELEAAVTAVLRREGLPVPLCEFRCIGRPISPRGAHLVERAVGTGLTEWDGDEPRMLEALGWVSRFLRRLHRIAGKGFGPLSLEAFRNTGAGTGTSFAGVHARWEDYVFLRLDEHVAACRSQGALTAEEAHKVGRLFEESRTDLRKQPAGLLHGDPGSHNFMVDEFGIRAVIDWEDALLGDPLFDLASLCTFHPERRHAAILSAYGANLTPGSGAWTRFWLYFLRLALAKTVHRHRFGYADRPDRPPASRRIQLALAKLALEG